MTTFLQLKLSQHDGFVPVTMIQLAGDLDGSTYEQFETMALHEIEAGARHMLLDLSRVNYISSAGLRVLYILSKTLLTHGGSSAKAAGQAGLFKSPFLKLLNPSSNVQSALEVMGLNMSHDIYDDFDKALASFSSTSASDHAPAAVSANMPFTLTEELKQTLRTSSPEAETQRRELLRGKRFLFVMGSYTGKIPMYEHARELGAKLVVMDGPGHWSKAAVQEGLFEHFIEVDLLPAETLPERAYAAIKASGLQFDGVATFEDYAGPLAALMANALGFPGHPLMSIGFSRNKIFTREMCVEAGIPSPRFFQIKSAADLAAAAAHVGFPAVLKPIAGCSSMATYFVNDENMLHQRYTHTISEVQGHLKTTGVHSDDEAEMVWAKGLDMTLEQYLDGEEFDVDVLLSEGNMVYANISRDLPQTHMKEVGSQMPPAFPPDKQAELIAFAELSLHALKFTDGSFHVELKYTSEGPRLIEINARIGGLAIYYLHRNVWGVDLAEQYLLTRLGVPIRPQKAAQPITCLLTSYLPSPRTGVVAHTDFLKPVIDHPHIVRYKTSVIAGQKVTGSDTGVPDLLGEIMVRGDTVEQASQIMDELLGKIEFPITSG